MAISLYLPLQKLLNVELMKSDAFVMSSPSRSRSSLTVAIGIVLVAVIGLGAGYYFAYAGNPSPNSFPVSWSVTPLTIKFAVTQTFSASAPDSFTCSPDQAPVTLVAQSNFPSNITITVSPTTFPSCGSTPDNVIVTASCTADHMNTSCDGDRYTGSITVCAPNPYTCLKKVLNVNVAVTTMP